MAAQPITRGGRRGTGGKPYTHTPDRSTGNKNFYEDKIAFRCRGPTPQGLEHKKLLAGLRIKGTAAGQVPLVQHTSTHAVGAFAKILGSEEDKNATTWWDLTETTKSCMPIFHAVHIRQGEKNSSQSVYTLIFSCDTQAAAKLQTAAYDSSDGCIQMAPEGRWALLPPNGSSERYLSVRLSDLPRYVATDKVVQYTEQQMKAGSINYRFIKVSWDTFDEKTGAPAGTGKALIACSQGHNLPEDGQVLIGDGIYCAYSLQLPKAQSLPASGEAQASAATEGDTQPGSGADTAAAAATHDQHTNKQQSKSAKRKEKEARRKERAAAVAEAAAAAAARQAAMAQEEEDQRKAAALAESGTNTKAEEEVQLGGTTAGDGGQGRGKPHDAQATGHTVSAAPAQPAAQQQAPAAAAAPGTDMNNGSTGSSNGNEGGHASSGGAANRATPPADNEPQKCLATTSKTGERCKINALPGSMYCYLTAHQNQGKLPAVPATTVNTGMWGSGGGSGSPFLAAVKADPPTGAPPPPKQPASTHVTLGTPARSQLASGRGLQTPTPYNHTPASSGGSPMDLDLGTPRPT